MANCIAQTTETVCLLRTTLFKIYFKSINLNTLNAKISNMAINEWKIWQKLGIVKRPKPHVEVEADVDAILDFLKSAKIDTKKILGLYREYLDLRGEEKALKKTKASHKKLVENVKKQIIKYDDILKAYEIFMTETDINGERVKKIAQSIRRKAKRVKVPKKWIEHTKKDMKWTFDW